MLIAVLLLAASAATPSSQTVTIGYEDVVTLARDADTLCPLVFDESIDAKDKGLRLKKLMSEGNYRGPKFALLNLLCGQWEKGYIEGARRRSR
jgi:hypothetical protein